MKSLPGEKAGAGEQTGRKLMPSVAYLALAVVQAPFGYVFWLIEERKARLQDQLANQGK